MECYERIFQFEDKVRKEKKTVTVTEVVNIRIRQKSQFFLKIICNLYCLRNNVKTFKKFLLTGHAAKLWFVCMAISSSASPIYMAQKRSNKWKKNSRGKCMYVDFVLEYNVSNWGK